MTFLRCLAVAISLSALSLAQLPGFYKTVNRVTWVVENLDKVRPAWEALGLSGVRVYTNIRLTGEFRGKPVTIIAWQLTGQLGNLTIDFIQPAEGQENAYTNFLEQHGDGILAFVHEVQNRQEMEREIARMKAIGVGVLQQLTHGDATFTYFDTEPEGKFVLGLVHRPAAASQPPRPLTVTHFSPVVWNPAAVSAYWQRLGFPAIAMQHLAPRPDSRYKGQPLSLAFDIGQQRYSQFSYEWISPPPNPPNAYADFLNKRRREGIQHIGILVDDLPAALAAQERVGYHVLQSGSWGDIGKPSSGQYAYLDTDTVGGIVLELMRKY